MTKVHFARIESCNKFVHRAHELREFKELHIKNKKQRLHKVPQTFSQGYLELRIYVNKVDVKNMIVQDKIG